ncbi:MAG: alpha/beta hydrolase [Sphingomonas sp.]
MRKTLLAAMLAGVTAITLAAPALAAATAPAAGQELTVPGPLAPLHGTLLQPAKPAKAPVILILPGSGPTDRDGNNPLGVKAAPYRLLAEALAAQGVASVRIDKRGIGASQAAVADANAVTLAAYAADARAWVAAARRETGAKCVWLLGHSEGGLIALSAVDGPGICGVVLVAAAGRPFGTILREQLHANPLNAPIVDQAEAALTALEKGDRVDVSTFHPALQGLFNPKVQGYLIDLLQHDPAKMAQGNTRPMLIVQGLSDIQIGEADARSLASARPDARLVLIPGMNHVLKQVGDVDRATNAASYANPDLPVDPTLVGTVAAFVKASG